MNNQIQTTSITPTGAASVLDDELGELVKELDAAVLYTPWGEESALPGDAAVAPEPTFDDKGNET